MARTTFAVAAILASLAAGRTYAETPGRRPTVEVVMDIRVAWLLPGSEAAGSPTYRCVNRV